MNSRDPLLIPVAILVGAAVLVFAAAVVRATAVRRRARRRVVERPNSHYTSELVKTAETRHRWHGIDLERIHEVNRAEVVRLLARVDATSADVLRPQERVFLDNMADISGVPLADLPPVPQPTSGSRPGDPPGQVLAPKGA